MKKKSLFVLGTTGGGAYLAYKKFQNMTDAFSKVVIFNNENITYEQDQEIEDTAVIFGSVNIDLTDINMEEETTLKVRALFSNITIKVPEGWKVVTDGKNKASNVKVSIQEEEEQEEEEQEEEQDKSVTLNIEYDMYFSNINISNE